MSVLSERRRRSQKQRRCFGCWYMSATNPIPAGAFYWAMWCANGSDASGYALCEPCHDFLETDAGMDWLKDGGYEFGPGDILEAREESKE